MDWVATRTSARSSNSPVTSPVREKRPAAGGVLEVVHALHNPPSNDTCPLLTEGYGKGVNLSVLHIRKFDGGLSVPTIQRAIGHASARTTERYLDPSRDLDRRACFSALSSPQNRAPDRALFSNSTPNQPKKKALLRQEGFQKRGGRDSNSQPPDRQSGALTN